MKRLCTAIVLVAALAQSAGAQELTGTLNKIEETGVITLGHRDSSVPFFYLDGKQQPVCFPDQTTRGR